MQMIRAPAAGPQAGHGHLYSAFRALVADEPPFHGDGLVTQPVVLQVARPSTERTELGMSGSRGFGSAWGEEAELVAFRVGEDRPRDIALA